MIRLLIIIFGMTFTLSGEALGKCGDPPEPNVDWSGCVVSAVTFANVDLSGANLRDILIVGSKIIDSNFSAADLTNARISTSDLSGSNFTEATLNRVTFTSVNLSGGVFKRAKIDLGRGTGVNLTDANFQDAQITDSWVEFVERCRTTMPDGSTDNTQCE